MSIRITVFDGFTPMVDQIALVSREAALECLSVAGAHLQREARAAMRRHKHPWNPYKRKDGSIGVYFDPKKKRELGLRISHSTLALENPPSMSAMITNYLNEKSMVAVVGGKHKAFVPKKREDGKVVGTLDRVPAVSKRTHAIIHMLNFGEANPYYEQAALDPSRRFGYRFMEAGYNAARGRIEESMTKRYEKIIHRHASRGDIKTVKRIVA